jgi:hypothetical protein
MKKYLALALVTATMSVGFSIFAAGNASAYTTRDHRICQASDPNCRDHRGPVIVVPPRDIPPVIVVQDPPPIDPGPGPRIPPEPPHRPPHPPIPDDGGWAHAGDEGDYGISCREGRAIVRHSGFRHVRAIDCSGDVFSYTADSRRGGRATVIVNMDGEIVRVNYWIAAR